MMQGKQGGDLIIFESQVTLQQCGGCITGGVSRGKEKREDTIAISAGNDQARGNLEPRF